MKKLLSFLSIFLVFGFCADAQIDISQAGNFAVIKNGSTYVGSYSLPTLSIRVGQITSSDTINVVIQIANQNGTIVDQQIAATSVSVNTVLAVGYIDLKNKLASAFPYPSGGGGAGSNVAVTNFPTLYPGDSTKQKQTVYITGANLLPVDSTKERAATYIIGSNKLPLDSTTQKQSTLIIGAGLNALNNIYTQLTLPLPTVANGTIGAVSLSGTNNITVTNEYAVAASDSVKLKQSVYITGANKLQVGVDSTTTGKNVVISGVGSNPIPITGSISNAGFSVTNTPTIANTGFAVTNTPTVNINGTVPTSIAGTVAISATGTTPVSIGATVTVTGTTSIGNTVTVTGTTTSTIGGGTLPTVTTVSTLTTLANGQTASGSAATGSALRIGGKVAPITAATLAVALTPGVAYDVALTTGQQEIIKPYQTAELDFTFNVFSTLSTTSVQQIIPASGQASIRNYITSLSYQTDAPGSAGNAWILDGAVAGSSVTIATPGVFTSAAHDLRVGDAIVFTSLGTITGVSTNTIYYITSTSFTGTTFTVATTQGGAAIAITGSTSAFTFYRVLYQIRLQTTAIGTPAVLTFPTPLRPQPNAAVNLLIPVSLTSGNIYLTPSGYRGY